MNLENEYKAIKEEYLKLGIDIDEQLKRLEDVVISIHCWQGDDVRGFISSEGLSGGIQATGNYLGRARNVAELRMDLEKVLSLLPGKFKVNLHAIYADSEEEVALDKLEPKHFSSWVTWAKEQHVGLDFNPTCFSHPYAESGFTLSSYDDEIRNFWIEHCKRSRKIGAYFGKELGTPCVTNIWIPDGYKDIPYDRLAPRRRLEESLNEIFAEKLNPAFNIDAVESKLFGIGLESYTVGNSEFYLGYAVKNQIALTLDSGHFHPLEYISDKLSSVSLFVPHILLHVSRPVRWDSDHVVILDDEVTEIARSLVRNNLLKSTSIGLDYFDASINRIAAWVIGIRSVQISLLKAMLEPTSLLKELENMGRYTERLYIIEHLKTMNYGKLYDYYCAINHKKSGMAVLEEIEEYEETILKKRV